MANFRNSINRWIVDFLGGITHFLREEGADKMEGMILKRRDKTSNKTIRMKQIST